MLFARASVVCAPQIYCKRQPRQSVEPPSLWQQLTTNALIFRGSRRSSFSGSSRLSDSCSLGNCLVYKHHPHVTTENWGHSAFLLTVPHFLCWRATHILKKIILFYFIIFGVLSRQFTFFSLYFLFKILSRTSLGCSFLVPYVP